MTGETSSTDFPTQNLYQASGGFIDPFVTKLNPAASGASSLLNSSYLGGSRDEFGYGIAVDSKSNIYVTGETRSTDFPSNNGYNKTRGGSFNDAFVTKIAP